MRGGTSKGPFFKESDLPTDKVTRDRVLLSVMGSPDHAPKWHISGVSTQSLPFLIFKGLYL